MEDCYSVDAFHAYTICPRVCPRAHAVVAVTDRHVIDAPHVAPRMDLGVPDSTNDPKRLGTVAKKLCSKVRTFF